MAGMCCGINVGENEPTSPVEPASRTARRRRMELRQIKFITDIADTTRFKRRKIEDQDEQQQQQKPSLILPATQCENFLTLKFPGEKPKESTLHDDDFPKFGYTSVCGRRRDMEDAVTIRPSFCKKDDSKNQPGFHFYGVYDGHGCSHVAKRCKERMHAIVKEEIEKNDDDDWTQALSQSFTRMDREVGDRAKNNGGASTSTSCRCELQTPQCDAVGSTAVVSVVTPEKIVVSNCGDSRAVLCRKGVAIPLSNDHKPDRPDELTRIEEAGGRVIYWDGARVLGMLAMSRAIGDNYLKPYVIPDPEVTVTDRTSDDECLILASDGLWDVVSNETAAAVARMCLINAEKPASPPRSPGNEAVVAATKDSSDKACSDASILLTKLALARQSADNVSVVVVDLRK
ncbi:protein phosphatase 2C 37-like [Chenopodium quinoa]|uniref:protein-serine/threonine phosphatase n=1 Tax=Chenopodium quinoa TaxID=63459 RepID=A0A803N526_CHEQI|nr:protein phosphatase 2C 37-like [Chenopodium quinoa]